MVIYKLVKLDSSTEETEKVEYFTTLELAKKNAPSTLTWNVEEHHAGNYLMAEQEETDKYGTRDYTYVIHTLNVKE